MSQIIYVSNKLFWFAIEFAVLQQNYQDCGGYFEGTEVNRRANHLAAFDWLPDVCNMAVCDLPVRGLGMNQR